MKTLNSFQISIGVISVLLMSACSNNRFDKATSDSGAVTFSSTSQAQVKVSLSVYDNANTLIYSDAVASSSLVLKAGQNYNLVLNPSQDLAGATYSLVLTETSSVSSSSQTIALKSGSNSFSVAKQGDYSLKLVTSAPNMLSLTKYYTADVTCSNPTFTAASLNGSNIAAQRVSGLNNLFSLSASGIASGADGKAPYTCAWDGTGVGIIDTAFVDCNSSISKFYNNLVGSRKVTVVVKDACNTVHSVSKVINFDYQVPAFGQGNEFIFGQVSSASGSAAGDSRVDAVTYLATNANNYVVQSVYSGSNFTIIAEQNYGMASSVDYGMTLQLSGISGSIDLATLSHNISLQNAKIKSVVYSTDQAGDSKGAVSFRSSACTLSNQNFKVIMQPGTPCASGSSGSGNSAIIEIWGNYTCTLTNSTGSIVVTGSFDGSEQIADSCYVGGAVSGGSPPISF